MANVYRYRTAWLVTPGGAGLSNLYFAANSGTPTSRNNLAAAVKAFFNGIRLVMAPGVTWTFESEMQELDASDGSLVTVHAVTPPAQETGGGSTGFAAPTGCRVRWETGNVVNGRRVRGGTYLVPLDGAKYETNGTIGSTTIGTIGTQAATLISASATAGHQLQVWSRANGGAYDVIAALAVDKAAVLRSRRD